MDAPKHGAPTNWVDTYRGHRIQVMAQDSAWLVALDDQPLPRLDFETPQEAVAWLRRQVDCRIAESMYPGLATV